jgi:hypothetical protein
MYEAKGATGGVGRRGRVAIGVAGALLVAVAAINLLPNTKLLVPSARPAAPSQVAETRAQPTPTALAQAKPTVVLTEPDGLKVGRNAMLRDGVSFSLELAPGWGSFGPHHDNYITKDEIGGQGAEAVIYWTRYPFGELAEPCVYLRKRANARTPDELAAAVSSVPGTVLISGPTDTAVGGRPAKHVEFTVRDDVGCDPGFFFTYRDVYGGALWPETFPGDTVRVWIVDLKSRLFWIQGATHTEATEQLVREMEQTIDSFRFD